MIYTLNGTLTIKEDNFIVVECSGVGYICAISKSTASELPNVGERVTVFTHMLVREDAIELIGFSSRDELSCFKILISVSGVGSKVALGILSTYSASKVALAISSENIEMLKLCPGIGKKTAQRIILELKDKFDKLNSGFDMGALKTSAPKINASLHSAQAINALIVLGYSMAEVTPVVNKLDSTLSTEQIIRLALKELGGS